VHLRIENHADYSNDIFLSPVKFYRHIQENAWSDFRLFSYKKEDYIQKIILEYPEKILHISQLQRDASKDPTPAEKNSGIGKNDLIYYQVREYKREKYAPYDLLKLPYEEYIALKMGIKNFVNLLHHDKASEMVKVIWEHFKDEDLKPYNLLQYSYRMRVQLKNRAGEDTFDFGIKEKDLYVFASLNLPYSRILKSSANVQNKLERLTKEIRPDPKFVEQRTPVLPKKEAPKQPEKKEEKKEEKKPEQPKKDEKKDVKQPEKKEEKKLEEPKKEEKKQTEKKEESPKQPEKKPEEPKKEEKKN
jgi:hypothetical protein